MNKIKFNSLKTKISIPIITIVIILFAIVVLLDYQMEKLTSKKLLQNELDTLGDLSRIAISAPLWNLDDDGINNAMGAILSDKEIGYLKVTDYSLNRYFENKIDDKKYMLDTLIYYEDDILHNGEVIGSIKIGMTTYYVNQQNENSIKFQLLRYILIVVMLLVLINYILRMITTPISRLTEKTKQISLGDLTTTIDINSSDEIGELSISVMKMQSDLKLSFDNIKSKNEEILILNKNLELKVAKRTSELENKISEIKDMQEMLIQSEKLASLGQLVAGIAHEMNTPLGVAITASSYLKVQNDKVIELIDNNSLSRTRLVKYFEQVNESSEMIYKNLRRTGSLIENFKNVAGNMYIGEITNINIKELIESIVLLLHNKFKNKNINIQIDTSEVNTIRSYSNSFTHIFTNLIINSIVHGFKDLEEGNLQIKTNIVGEYITIQYSDDGHGISKEHISRVFDPFFTTRREIGGLGLGLNIIYNIVTDNLRGTIKVTSEENESTNFIITIPNIIEP